MQSSPRLEPLPSEHFGAAFPRAAASVHEKAESVGTVSVDVAGRYTASRDTLQSTPTVQKHFSKHLSFKSKARAPTAFIKDSRGMLERVVSNPGFPVLVNSAVFASALQMGFQAQWAGDEHWDFTWRLFENVFTAIFAVEMFMKIVVMGLRYFRDAWNCIDFLITWLSIVDAWIMPYVAPSFISQSSLGAVRQLRVFRLLRLLRILKVIRSVPELLMVVEGVVGSVRAMSWILLLLGISIYVWAIICVEVIGSQQGYPEYRQSDHDDMFEEALGEFNNFFYFGNLERSMLSTLNMILLTEWAEIVRPMWVVQPLMVFALILFTFISTFGILNLIVGVIVERMMAAMLAAKEDSIEVAQQKRIHLIEEITHSFFDLDSDGDQMISKKEMLRAANDEHLRELMKTIDLPNGFSFQDFHEMIDSDGNGLLSKREFVQGMLRLIQGDIFQQACLNQLLVAKLKSEFLILKGSVLDEFAAFRGVLEGIPSQCHDIARAQAKTFEASVPRKDSFPNLQEEVQRLVGCVDAISANIQGPLDELVSKARSPRGRHERQAVLGGHREGSPGDSLPAGRDVECDFAVDPLPVEDTISTPAVWITNAAIEPGPSPCSAVFAGRSHPPPTPSLQMLIQDLPMRIAAECRQEVQTALRGAKMIFPSERVQRPVQRKNCSHSSGWRKNSSWSTAQQMLPAPPHPDSFLVNKID